MSHFRVKQRVRRALHLPPDLVDYWEVRAGQHGRRAVLDISHTDQEYDAVTELQRRELFPYLASSLNGRERMVLDFGCGPGRFTPSLADLVHGAVIGVDPVRSLIEIAPRATNVEYRVSDGRVIPLADDSVDVVWICLVLGGIRELGATVGELKRVARPDALLFIAENTSERQDLPHWFYRSVEDYRQAFDAPLDHVHDYVDQGERISILRGRL
jgi:ubiquinone/menaquinone biosynthesis C-methylase UbiE